MTLSERVESVEADNEVFNRTIRTLTRIENAAPGSRIESDSIVVGHLHEVERRMNRFEESMQKLETDVEILKNGMGAMFVHFNIPHPTFNP